jgi:general secretion pathway protein H
MTWLDNARTRRHGEAGFTLIELVVVFVILGLVLTLFVTRISGPSPGLQIRAAANELAAGLRQARSTAIARDRSVTIVVDTGQHAWRAADGAIKTFPPGAAVGIVMANGDVAQGAMAIRFESDGSSSGGRVDLAAGRQRIAVEISWLTGRVTVANAR